jgi:hypothetical protein
MVAIIVSLLLGFLLPSNGLASEGLFAGGYEWRLELRGLGAVADLSATTEGGKNGIAVSYDFRNVEPEELSVWVGIYTNDANISYDQGNLSFRVSSTEPALLKVTISDSAEIGYDLQISIVGGGAWEEQLIPIDFSSFPGRWGKAVSEAPQEITFPVVRVAISVIRSEDYPLEGVVTISDLP